MKLSFLLAFLFLASLVVSGLVSGKDAKDSPDADLEPARDCGDQSKIVEIDDCSLCCAENLFNRFDHKLFLKQKSCRCYMDTKHA